MSQPRKHHYLPQFYLRNFSRDGDSLFQFEKSTGKSYGGRIKDLAAIRDFHRLDFDGPEDPQAIEKYLAQVEAHMSGHLDSLLQNGIGDRQALTETIGFVSLLRMRVPAVKSHIEASLGAAIRVAAEAMERQGRLPTPPPGLEDKLKIANLNIEVSNWKCMELMFGMAFNPDVLQIMCNMQAVLYRAPDGSFVTCNQPIALFHRNKNSPYGVGPATDGVEVSAPLSNGTLLLLRHADGPNEERTASKDEITEFNRRAIVMAEQYVYAGESSEELVSTIAELRDSSAGFRFDMLRAQDGAYQVFRCMPVYPADD